MSEKTPTTYLGNPNLKRAHVPVGFSEHEVKEYMKCLEDPIYFIEQYVKIVHVDKGLIPFKMWDFQRNMVETFVKDRFVICKMPRQSGKSTTIISYLLHYVLFHENVSVGVLANKGQTARELLGRLQLAYEHLPKWLQQGIVEWNKGNINLENGSKILACATSSSAIRGGTFNIIFLDEFAFVPNTLAEQFFSSVYPTISSGQETKVLIVSTPKGMNMFYKMWVDAEEKRSHYTPIEVHWNNVPGRDDAWRKQTIANTSEDQFRTEFECEFIGSTQTLVLPSKLRTIPWKTPKYEKDNLRVFEEPKPKHIYALTVDTARGQGNDNSAFSVIDITESPYKQVVAYSDPNISPLLFPNLINKIGNEYNTAYVLVEINDIGQQVADILHHDLEYEEVLKLMMKGRSGQMIGGGFTKRVQYGIRTTKSVKAIGCANLKSLIENDILLINDFDTVKELTSFVTSGPSFKAEDGAHDDLTMTLVLFGWLAAQKYFKELTDQDLRLKIYQERIRSMEAEVIPFGFIGDENQSSFVDADGQRWETVDEDVVSRV